MKWPQFPPPLHPAILSFGINLGVGNKKANRAEEKGDHPSGSLPGVRTSSRSQNLPFRWSHGPGLISGSISGRGSGESAVPLTGELWPTSPRASMLAFGRDARTPSPRQARSRPALLAGPSLLRTFSTRNTLISSPGLGFLKPTLGFPLPVFPSRNFNNYPTHKDVAL